MKELSTEDKAKRYDEAIKRAKSKIKNDKNHVLYEDDVIEIFPKLKESENERIRKDIIATLHLYFGEPLDDEAKEMIDWVEKQSQTFTKKDVDDAYLKGISDAKNELEKQGKQKLVLDFKAKNWYVSKVDGKIHDMTYNPTNKVEPNKKNNMKVFGCNAQLPYSGGGILVAANTKEEAYLTAAYDDKTSIVFDWADDNDMWCEPDGNINHCRTDTYPINNWFEVEHLFTDLTKPQVIIEDHYSE